MAEMQFAAELPEYTRTGSGHGDVVWPVAPVLRAQGLAVVAWPVQAGAQFEGPCFEVIVAADDLAVPGQVDPRSRSASC